jgi:hypothetical protein
VVVVQVVIHILLLVAIKKVTQVQIQFLVQSHLPVEVEVEVKETLTLLPEQAVLLVVQVVVQDKIVVHLQEQS